MVLVRNSDTVIMSECGVRQGDPCGPLFFALTVPEVLEDFQAQELARVVAFAEDTFLQGSQQGVQTTFHSASTILEHLNLQLTSSKCSAYSAGAGSAAVAQNLGIRYAVQRIVAASSPVGQPDFVAAHAVECASKACDLTEALDALPLAVQARCLLLHGSLQLRAVHLPHVGKWEEVGRAVEAAEDRTVHNAFAIIGRERSPTANQQLSLPRRHGGFGIRVICQLQGQAGYSYLSAAAMTKRVMDGGPAAFRPFEGPSCAVLCPAW
jgi:hypothetical protein